MERTICISSADMDALDRCVRFIVDREAPGKGFAELNGAECGGEGEEFGDVHNVT